MAEAVTINEKEYIFDLNRENYRKYVLQDYEYATIQTKLASMATEKSQEKSKKGEEISKEIIGKSVAEAIIENDVTLLQQITMVKHEKIFFASLIKNYPTITQSESNELLDKAIEEYGDDEVAKLCNDLTARFAPKLKDDEPKKKMMRRTL
jgi:thiaminase